LGLKLKIPTIQEGNFSLTRNSELPFSMTLMPPSQGITRLRRRQSRNCRMRWHISRRLTKLSWKSLMSGKAASKKIPTALGEAAPGDLRLKLRTMWVSDCEDLIVQPNSMGGLRGTIEDFIWHIKLTSRTSLNISSISIGSEFLFKGL
jgi:hypothetical protein